MLDISLRLLLTIVGIWLIVWTLMSIIRMLLLPRSDNVPLTRFMFRAIYKLFYIVYLCRVEDYRSRDRVLSFWVPITLIALLVAWMFLIWMAYTLVYLGVSQQLNLREALVMSGSSLMTLGFKFADEIPVIVAAFTEALVGMMLVALLIGYLPAMYAAYSERERVVTRLEYIAGMPPSPVTMIERLSYISVLSDTDALLEVWKEWENWFAQIEESHTTLAPLNFFRSPASGRSWVTAGGVVLDCASLIASSVDVRAPLQSGLMIRSGFVALRAIADFFRMSYDPDPQPNDPISITREEFDVVLDQIAALGVPLKPNRDQSWHDFSGWRVNYDSILRRLAEITYAPYAMWISDHVLNPDGTPKTQMHVLVNAENLSEPEFYPLVAD